jgi:imidazolonepropionase-like amidohydrolase
MKIDRRCALTLLYLAATPGGHAIAQPAPVLVFEHANVIDGVSSAALRDVTVMVADGRVKVVGRESGTISGSMQRIDLAGRWMLPGLIDAHVHPSSLQSAQNMLKAGITTGRSMLTTNYVDVGLRQLHERGDVDIPDILAAGYPIIPIPTQFKPDVTSMFLNMPELDDLRKDADLGVSGVRRLVRANLDHHVDVIKVFASDRAGVANSDPRRRLLSDEQLAVAVDEAHKAGVPLAAHAYGEEAVGAAVRAGVDTIEHGGYLPDNTLRLMHEHHVCFTPTLAVLAMIANTTSTSPEDVAVAIRSRGILPRSRETVRHARQIGVTVIAGTDGGYTPTDPHQISDEMAELAATGMPPMEVIQAATSKAAECLGIAKRTGSIRPGLEADLIVLDSDPLSDINAVRDVLLVVNDGKIAVNRLKF